MQEKRTKQQQIQKQVWDSRAPNAVAAGEKQQDIINGKPQVYVPNGVNGEKQQDVVNGKPKASVLNGVNADVKVPAEKATPPPAVTYAAKVAQTPATVKVPQPAAAPVKVAQPAAAPAKVAQTAAAPEKKPAVANGAVKTGLAA